MATKSTPYTLPRGREGEFRRTVRYQIKKAGKLVDDPKRKPVMFTFQPDVDVELTPEEEEFMKPDIDAGFIVRADRDAKGRLRRQRPVAEDGDAETQIAALEARIEELAGANASLKSENEKLATELAELNDLLESDDSTDLEEADEAAATE